MCGICMCVCVFINKYTKIHYKLGLLSICLRCNTRVVYKTRAEYKSYVNLGGGKYNQVLHIDVCMCGVCMRS